MISVLNAADVRRQDAEAEARGIAVETLMRAAGASVSAAAAGMLGRVYGRRVVVVCGKGNNGGDGFVAARLLARRGASVATVLAGGVPSGAPARALAAVGSGVHGVEDLPMLLDRADLAVDAVLGVGLTRAPEGDAGTAVRSLASASCPVLCVDVPSGLDADNGAVYGDAVRGWHTVTFTGFKPGLLFAAGAELAGLIQVAGIGIPPDLAHGTAVALEEADVRRLLPERATDANKYRSGVTLVVAGSRGMPGAAALVAGAAVRGGSGLVMLAAPQPVFRIAVERTPEVVAVDIDDSGEGVFDEKGLESVRQRLSRATSLAIGPGLSRHPATQEAVRTLIRDAVVPMVIDADALNAFEGNVDELRDRRAEAVLTPHEGEFERLSGAAPGDRIADARALATKTGCTILLKGFGSVIAAPDGRTAVNPTGGANLASAGTGDVLTGLIAALLARGMDPFDATASAAWLHGTAADLLAPALPSASQVLEQLGALLGSLR